MVTGRDFPLEYKLGVFQFPFLLDILWWWWRGKVGKYKHVGWFHPSPTGVQDSDHNFMWIHLSSKWWREICLVCSQKVLIQIFAHSCQLKVRKSWRWEGLEFLFFVSTDFEETPRTEKRTIKDQPGTLEAHTSRTNCNKLCTGKNYFSSFHCRKKDTALSLRAQVSPLLLSPFPDKIWRRKMRCDTKIWN